MCHISKRYFFAISHIACCIGVRSPWRDKILHMCSRYIHPFIQNVLSEFNECLVWEMMNYWKETRSSDCEVWSVVRFLTIENNSRVEICCRLCAAYIDENVMNLRNIQRWQLIFREERSNIHNMCKGQPSTTLDETVWCIRAHLRDDHHLSITDIRQEMAIHFSHKACEATIGI